VFAWKKLYDGNAPTVHLILPPIIDLGGINNGQEGSGTFAFVNNGPIPIQIQSISPSTPQVKVFPQVLTIPASSSASVHVSWLITTDTSPGKKTHTATLGIRSSDPALPFVTITVQIGVNGGRPQ
jgi:hypothetical protein